MRAVIQRVSEASVGIDDSLHSSIAIGLLVLLGIENRDTEEDVEWLIKKIVNLRIFNDNNEVMNRSVTDVGGDILVVSQFTLHARTKKGNRPSYVDAAPPNISIPLYQCFLTQMETEMGKPIFSGVFGADMKVALVNNGPVTIVIDTKNRE